MALPRMGLLLPLPGKKAGNRTPSPIPAPFPSPNGRKSVESTGKDTPSGETAMGLGEGLRAGDQTTQTGRGKIQDGLERKGKSKEPKNIYKSNKHDGII